MPFGALVHFLEGNKLAPTVYFQKGILLTRWMEICAKAIAFVEDRRVVNRALENLIEINARSSG